MTADERHGLETPEPAVYGDAEAEAASGVPLPSLRVLQAAGAIHSQKEPKEHGGFRRMWSEPDVLKAAIASAMGEHFSFNIRMVAETIAKTRTGVWDALIAIATAGMEANKDGAKLVTTSKQDWFLDLIDRKFLFLRVPEIATALLPDANYGQTDLLLGMVTSKDTFRMLPWSLDTKAGLARITELVGKESSDAALLAYRFALAAHNNYLSRASINVGMQVRAAWRRLHGLESRFVQEILEPRK